MSDSPEDRAEADMSLAALDALADKWAAEMNLPILIKHIVHPMRLNKSAPQEVREKFIGRMEALIDSIARQAFIEGALSVIDGAP